MRYWGIRYALPIKFITGLLRAMNSPPGRVMKSAPDPVVSGVGLIDTTSNRGRSADGAGVWDVADACSDPMPIGPATANSAPAASSQRPALLNRRRLRFARMLSMRERRSEPLMPDMNMTGAPSDHRQTVRMPSA